MSEDDKKIVRSNTFAFAGFLAQTIKEMTGRSYKSREDSFKETNLSFFPAMHAVIRFYGAVYGEYIVSLREETAARLIEVWEDGMTPEQLGELRNDFSDFISEMLNAAVGRAAEELKKTFEEPTISPVTMIYGEMKYPDISYGNVYLEGDDGSRIGCSFLLNRMNLKIAEKLEQARDNLLIKKRENDQLRENLKQITDTLPELNKNLEELFIIQNLLYRNPGTNSNGTNSNGIDSNGINSNGISGFGQYQQQLTNVGSKIRNILMVLWSVPLQETFDKVMQPVGQYSHKFSKSIKVTISSGEIEIDRGVNDLIFNILEALIRAIIEYAIEPPEERRQKGKPEEGHIQLRGIRKGGHILIEIEEDGRGFDRKRLLERSVRLGMVRRGARLSDHEIDQLVFLKPPVPGADIWTTLYNIREMIVKKHGAAEVLCREGKGNIFTVKIPVSMSITEGIIVGSASVQYIIPVTVIREIIRPEKKDYHTIEGKKEIIGLRGRIIPLIRLDRVFGIQREEKKPWEALSVIVEYNGKTAAVMVDKVDGKQEVAVQSIEKEGGADSEYIIGGAIMGDGRVGLVIDVDRLIQPS